MSLQYTSEGGNGVSGDASSIAEGRSNLSETLQRLKQVRWRRVLFDRSPISLSGDVSHLFSLIDTTLRSLRCEKLKCDAAGADIG